VTGPFVTHIAPFAPTAPLWTLLQRPPLPSAVGRPTTGSSDTLKPMLLAPSHHPILLCLLSSRLSSYPHRWWGSSDLQSSDLYLLVPDPPSLGSGLRFLGIELPWLASRGGTVGANGQWQFSWRWSFLPVVVPALLGTVPAFPHAWSDDNGFSAVGSGYGVLHQLSGVGGFLPTAVLHLGNGAPT
jgi:hypothetical protein